MDPIDTANSVNPPPHGTGDRKKEYDLSWDLGQLSALAAVVGLVTSMTYLLGLYVLWMPLAREYTHDTVTALYSASIVPKTVVVSLGLSRIWIPTLFTALVYSAYLLPEEVLSSRVRKALRRILLGAILAFWVWLAVDLIRPEDLVVVDLFSLGRRERIRVFKELSSSNLIQFGILYLASAVIFMFTVAKGRKYLRLAFKRPPEGGSPDELASEGNGTTQEGNGTTQLPGSAQPQRSGTLHEAEASASPSTQPAYVGRLMHAIEDLRFPDIASRANLLKAIATLFSMSFLLSIIFITTQPQVPVPTVEIDRTHDKNVEGELLAHVEGFWYVADQEKGEIVAVPDGEIETVRVFAKHD